MFACGPALGVWFDAVIHVCIVSVHKVRNMFGILLVCQFVAAVFRNFMCVVGLSTGFQ